MHFHCLLLHMFCLQSEVMGISIWRRNEIPLCKIFWLAAAAEGEELLKELLGVK